MSNVGMRRQLRPGEQVCGYGCSEPWRPFAGTTLIGHSRCAISDEEKLKLLERTEAPGVTYAMAAAERGVSVAVIRAWVAQAMALRVPLRTRVRRSCFEVTDALVEDLLVVKETFPVTIDRLARDVGVSKRVMAHWLFRARRARRRRAA